MSNKPAPIDNLRAAFDKILIDTEAHDFNDRIMAMNRRIGFLAAINAMYDLIGCDDVMYFVSETARAAQIKKCREEALASLREMSKSGE